jgi:hypothetical protein
MNNKYNVVKGRIEESIVSEMFKDFGYEVYAHGIEATQPRVSQLLRDKKISGLHIKPLRNSYDFLLVSKTEDKNGMFPVYKVEVKYRGHQEKKGKILKPIIKHSTILEYEEEDIQFILFDEENIYYLDANNLHNYEKDNKFFPNIGKHEGFYQAA